MADPEIEKEADKKYRKKSTHHMFMQALWGGLGGASFIGVLMTIAAKVLSAFEMAKTAVVTTTVAGGATTVTTQTTAAVTSGLLGISPVGWAVIGGMMLAGAAFTYMSQVEGTKLKEVQDNYLARKNAECLAHGHCHEQEYDNNKRADGKSWQEALAHNARSAARLH